LTYLSSPFAGFRKMHGRISIAKQASAARPRSMALYDMLRNANRVSLNDIVRRQKILSKGYDVLQPPDADDWKAPYAANRTKFVRAFYDYARANPNGRPQLWSEWQKSGPH